MYQHVILQRMVVALEKWYGFQKDLYSKPTFKDPRKFGYKNQNMIIWIMDSLKQSWYIDSGCSKHMEWDASKFIHISPKNSGHVTYEDNNKGKILGVGKIGMNPSTSIESILLVDGLKHSLLSIHQLCDKGLLVPKFS